MNNMGHSVTEYAIIGFLVVLISIAALGVLGVRVDELFTHSSQGISQADGLFSLLSGRGGGGANGGAAAAANGTGTPQGTNSVAVESNGTVFDPAALSSMASGLISTSVNGQDDLAAAVEKVGSSGMTASRLESFNEEIDSRLASGEITEAQAGRLRQLSNQGYRIAQIERIVENAEDPFAPVVFEGTTYPTAYDLASKIGWLNDSPSEVLSTGRVMDPNYPEVTTETKAFLQIYQDVDASLSDPETREWVGAMAQEITLLTEVVENAANKRISDPDLDIKQYSASTITTLDSDAFCAAGEGGGNGAVCMQ